MPHALATKAKSNLQPINITTLVIQYKKVNFITKLKMFWASFIVLS